MNNLWHAFLSLAGAFVASGTALGQPTTDAFPCPQQIADIATCYSAKMPTGALVLTAMPKKWNGNLIVFAHGGPGPLPVNVAPLSAGGFARYAIEVKLGYAWVGSTYRYLGFGVRQSAEDTEQARQYFSDRFGKPKRTILHGASYGGLVGAKSAAVAQLRDRQARQGPRQRQRSRRQIHDVAPCRLDMGDVRRRCSEPHGHDCRAVHVL